MKYKIGDKVRIKNLDWYNENKNNRNEIIFEDNPHWRFVANQSDYCGQIATITSVSKTAYRLEHIPWNWTDEMIEGLDEEENNDCEKCGLIRNSTRCLFMDNCPHNKQKNIIEIPKDYVIKDENGNVILTSKIILEKKKKKVTYPKTYAECCEIVHSDPKFYVDTHLYSGTLGTLYKLLICRDAYWKIAGEEMGLGKPWEPDWSIYEHKFCLGTDKNKVIEEYVTTGNRILALPTAEMRDAFYENFKSEIESCKELL